jgi:exo-beta-1,3-glucanase (GH17 family)
MIWQTVNIMPNVLSILAPVARPAVLIAALSLAACSKNWESYPAYNSVGGTVAGLNGILVLRNSDGDSLRIEKNGPFVFALQIAHGASYSVSIGQQPAGATCQLANASGVALADVGNISVTCVADVTIGGQVNGLNGTLVLQNIGANAPFAAAPLQKVTVSGTGSGSVAFTFPNAVAGMSTYAVSTLAQPAGQTCLATQSSASGTAAANVTDIVVNCTAYQRRSLPALFSNGKAVAYGPYRTGGPGSSEAYDPTLISQDLALMQAAGFNLVRYFSSAGPFPAGILQVASQQFPLIKFQLGIYLYGPLDSNCVDPQGRNSAEIAAGIALANQYPNTVLAVSVGNETSLAGNESVACLTEMVSYVRDHVMQPVTADDDWTFYAGAKAGVIIGGAAEKPDILLPLLDYVSIHEYPLLNTSWNWQQSSVQAGYLCTPLQRACAMMQGALSTAQAWFGQVANYTYSYRNPAGQVVQSTIAQSHPITIGETGWKWEQTAASSAFEACCAKQANAKWYFDLLYGNSMQTPAIPAWQGSANGPQMIFYFEAFNEPWKQAFNDDGWGLWDVNRNALYALCGTPAASAPCIAPPNTYQDAGFAP